MGLGVKIMQGTRGSGDRIIGNRVNHGAQGHRGEVGSRFLRKKWDWILGRGQWDMGLESSVGGGAAGLTQQKY